MSLARQASARRTRRRVGALFVVALLALVVLAGLAAASVWTATVPWLAGDAVSTKGLDLVLAHLLAVDALFVLVLTIGGAVRCGIALSDGGPGLARLLGARPVAPETLDPGEQRLRGIAHEISIDAASPMPALYLLDDEDGINACAAGHDARDAAVIVTRGALSRLSRDELQAVYAHEFAHILHGDARTHLRLAAAASGLLLPFQFGRALRDWARPLHSVGRGRIRGGPVAKIAFAAGSLVMAAGVPGWVLARLLQAAADRRRDLHADAAAVRLTQLPQALGNALRKGESLARAGDGRMINPAAPVTAHAWLLPVDRHRGPLATHPSVPDRLLRIFGRPASRADVAVAPADVPEDSQSQSFSDETVGFVPTRGGGFERLTPSTEPRPDGARALIRGWPHQWHAAAAAVRRAQGARAVALALVSPGRAEPVGLQGARGHVTLAPSELPLAARQALLELAASTLRHEPVAARVDLLRQARRLIESDAGVTLVEFVLYITLADRLGNRLGATRRHARVRREEASSPLGLLIRAAIVWPGSNEPASLRSLRAAMERAQRCWGASLWWPPGDIPAGEVVAAIRTIGALGLRDQADAVDALSAAFLEAPVIDPAQAALLRALCHAWGVLPPAASHGLTGAATRPPSHDDALDALNG